MSEQIDPGLSTYAQLVELRKELSAMTQRAEAAEARIKYLESFGIPCSDGLSPDVAELQRTNEFYRGEYRVLSENGFGTAMDAVIQANFSKARAEENADLTRKLAEQQAVMKNYDFDESDYAELTKLLAEAKSKTVPEGWQLVPIIPTDEMLLKLLEIMRDAYKYSYSDNALALKELRRRAVIITTDAYIELLAAAPQPEERP